MSRIRKFWCHHPECDAVIERGAMFCALHDIGRRAVTDLEVESAFRRASWEPRRPVEMKPLPSDYLP